MRFLHRSLGPLLFPSLMWRTASSSVHLTFDDGPHSSATPQVLDVLYRFNIHATFFMTGDRVRMYPDVARRVAKAGHQIGNHAMSHQSLFLKSAALQEKEVNGGRVAIADIIGSAPTLFRPPYGVFDFATIRIAENAGQRFVMWDVDSKDYRHTGTYEIVARVVPQSRRGSIILLHDNGATADRISNYLTLVVESLLKRELTFAPISL